MQKTTVETDDLNSGQLTAEQIVEFLRNNPEKLQGIGELLKTQPENPQTPDLSAAEEKAEREKEPEEEEEGKESAEKEKAPQGLGSGSWGLPVSP